MESFSEFFNELLNHINIKGSQDLSIDQVRFIISKTNEYFYTYEDGIGTTYILEDDYEYFSEFHKFWEKYHDQILNPKINDEKCELTADILDDISKKYGRKIFYELYDTSSLTPKEICQIRYFSANQDFRGSRNFVDLVEVYIDDPTIFDKQKINENPEDFLKNIGITSLSQNDKRVKYAQVASQILIDLNIESFDILKHFDRDILSIRDFLLSHRGSGFGNKKVDMFIRDMVVLDVWKKPINFDKIDVASDINTIKVALRTGILETAIPLVSSFLDMFCYQYGLISDLSALAWRRVWEIWNKKYPKTCIDSPCLIDFLVYRIIGKEFCKEKLCLFESESKRHTFKWHSGRNKTCQVCKKEKAHVVSKILPCMDKEGYLVIEKSKFVNGEKAILNGIKECPFSKICQPQNKNFKKFNPPKSISILGQTGWESARTLTGEGGGGLMS